MNSVRGTAALPAVGFPIRTSPDQSLVSGSPTLFAATHVLLRLLSPRHPSCALCSLVISLHELLPLLEKTRVQRGSVVNQNLRPTTTHSPITFLLAHMQFSKIANPGGADRDRTDDIQLAKLALSQLSYGPISTTERSMVGLGRFELPTPRLSSVCSNQLSYRPIPRPSAPGFQRTKRDALGLSKPDSKPT
jgi:hypothetical protein